MAQTITPADHTQRLMLAKEELKRLQALYNEHVTELVEQLFVKYQQKPDAETQRLLVIHMGSKFFERTALLSAGRKE